MSTKQKLSFSVILNSHISTVMKNVRVFLMTFFTLLLLSPLSSYANDTKLEYKVKAAYLYNFTKFINWPDDVFPVHEAHPFKICILGDNPFGHSLDLISNKTAQGHNVKVEYLETINTQSECHVIFISKSREKEIQKIFEVLTSKNILTVSDINDFTTKGGGISLDIVNGKVQFNVNLQATNKAGLKVSAKLLELAKSVIK